MHHFHYREGTLYAEDTAIPRDRPGRGHPFLSVQFTPP